MSRPTPSGADHRVERPAYTYTRTFRDGVTTERLDVHRRRLSADDVAALAEARQPPATGNE